MFKKRLPQLFSIVLTVSLVCFSNFFVFAESINDIKYSSNRGLSTSQVETRAMQIVNSYEINEPLSDEDAEFVTYYLCDSSANSTENPIRLNASMNISYDGHASKNVNVSNSSYGVNATLSGTIFTNPNIVNHQYGGNLKVKINSGTNKMSKIKITISCTAFGLLGESGTYIGIVAKDSTSSTSSTKAPTSWSFNTTKSYSAVGVVSTLVTAQALITTTSGAFTVS